MTIKVSPRDIGSMVVGIDIARLREDACPGFVNLMLTIVRHCHGYVQGDLPQKTAAHILLKGIEDFYQGRKEPIERADFPAYRPLKGLVALLPELRMRLDALCPGQRTQASYLEETAIAMIGSYAAYEKMLKALNK